MGAAALRGNGSTPPRLASKHALAFSPEFPPAPASWESCAAQSEMLLGAYSTFSRRSMTEPQGLFQLKSEPAVRDAHAWRAPQSTLGLRGMRRTHPPHFSFVYRVVPRCRS